MIRSKNDWQRVSRRRPCPVCGKPDWCTFLGREDSPELVCCMRVESDRPAKNGGYYHRLRDSDDWRRPPRRRVRTVAVKPEGRPIRDLGGFARLCHSAALPQGFAQLADALGVSRQSLARLLVGWSGRHRSWTFPMSDAAGRVVGVRLRLSSGRKLAVKGGREGLFLPEGLSPGRRLLVCEGPTDCASLLDLGFPAVGRPSCSGGVRHLVEMVTQRVPEEVVVVADNDQPDRRARRPGQDGAERLASELLAYCPAVKVIAPPPGVKDARAWVQAGGTAADVQQAIDAAPVRRLKVTVRQKDG